MRKAVAGFAFLSALGGGSIALADPAVDVSGAAPCAIDVFSTDKDPKGLNVRAAPSANAPLVTTLENSRRMSDDDFAVEMHVTGVKDGWLLIDKAWFGDYGTDEEKAKAGTVFTGKGWISGKLAGLYVKDVVLRSAPAADAKPTFALAGKDSSGPGEAGLDVQRIFNCKGRWVEVEGVFGANPALRRGWAMRTCSNQVESCP